MKKYIMDEFVFVFRHRRTLTLKSSTFIIEPKNHVSVSLS